MPWVDDPETGTSHYERPKKVRSVGRKVIEDNAEALALLAAHDAATKTIVIEPNPLVPTPITFCEEVGMAITDHDGVWWDDPNHAQVEDTTNDGQDFLDEIVEERTRQNPDFPALVEESFGARMARLKRENKAVLDKLAES